jgi:CRISPR-associated endonuclease/helicase Cas3
VVGEHPFHLRRPEDAFGETVSKALFPASRLAEWSAVPGRPGKPLSIEARYHHWCPVEPPGRLSSAGVTASAEGRHAIEVRRLSGHCVRPRARYHSVMVDPHHPLLLSATTLWAKLDRDSSQQVVGWHSLVDHSADVAVVVSELLTQPTINRRLAVSAGRTELDNVTCARLCALSFLHDIGKANRGFRLRIDPKAPNIGHINQLAWLFKDPFAEKLAKKLEAVLGFERMESWFASETALELWDTIFAHHGRPWSNDPAPAAQYWKPDAAGDPIAELAPMRTALDAWFAGAFSAGPSLPEAPAFHHAFAGLLMLADWLGSDTRFFPFAHGAPVDRIAHAVPAARSALREVGLAVEERRAAVKHRGLGFADLFDGRSPRPVQEAATLPTANCVVLEAETGSGKTEAALWRFQHLFQAGAVDGLYFALPTRVAASQMFARVRRFRDALFPSPDRPTVVLAIPGQVGADDAKGHMLPGFFFEWNDLPDEAARQARWAAEHPKRFLAAQIVVGTVDQALLGAITTRHAHLRATALLRHLLVVDEVHASDRYMETLLGNLLRGHLQAGGHALLLSATLGAGMRARLLGTPCPAMAAAVSHPYPALSWAEAGRFCVRNVDPTGTTKAVRLNPAPLLDDAAAIASIALNAANAGAKVLVIRNTVRAAIDTAEALEVVAGPSHPALFRVAGVATLHHGRFAPSDRELLDAAVEVALGKDSAAVAQVVIGTQTLEQSLDLDADFLITDLCPVDVLLQRVGRLHRHAERPRPAGFAKPRALVLTPAGRDLLPLLRGGHGRHGLGRVYDDPRVIEATWRLVETEPVWHIPQMNRHLVERAIHPERLASIEAELRGQNLAWAGVLDRYYGSDLARAQQAGLGLLDRSAPFRDFTLDGADPFSTRLGGKDLLVSINPPVLGPFGRLLEGIKVSHYLAGDAPADAEIEVTEHGPDGLVFRLGSGTLRYDRFGLRRKAA